MLFSIRAGLDKRPRGNFVAESRRLGEKHPDGSNIGNAFSPASEDNVGPEERRGAFAEGPTIGIVDEDDVQVPGEAPVLESVVQDDGREAQFPGLEA